MKRPTSTDVGTAPAFPPSEHAPSASTIGSKPATVVSTGLIGDASSTANELKAATISEAERPPQLHPVQANNPGFDIPPGGDPQMPLPPGQSAGVPEEDAPMIGSTSTTATSIVDA